MRRAHGHRHVVVPLDEEDALEVAFAHPRRLLVVMHEQDALVVRVRRARVAAAHAVEPEHERHHHDSAPDVRFAAPGHPVFHDVTERDAPNVELVHLRDVTVRADQRVVLGQKERRAVAMPRIGPTDHLLVAPGLAVVVAPAAVKRPDAVRVRHRESVRLEAG